MGRVKLKIKRLESASNRQVTYSKRRNGILKKAKELLILCDIDILLLMFSPTGKPTLFLGEHSCWSNAHKIDNIEHLRQLEDSLRESINRILMEKEAITNLGCKHSPDAMREDLWRTCWLKARVGGSPRQVATPPSKSYAMKVHHLLDCEDLRERAMAFVPSHGVGKKFFLRDNGQRAGDNGVGKTGVKGSKGTYQPSLLRRMSGFGEAECPLPNKDVEEAQRHVREIEDRVASHAHTMSIIRERQSRHNELDYAPSSGQNPQWVWLSEAESSKHRLAKLEALDECRDTLQSGATTPGYTNTGIPNGVDGATWTSACGHGVGQLLLQGQLDSGGQLVELRRLSCAWRLQPRPGDLAVPCCHLEEVLCVRDVPLLSYWLHCQWWRSWARPMSVLALRELRMGHPGSHQSGGRVQLVESCHMVYSSLSLDWLRQGDPCEGRVESFVKLPRMPLECTSQFPHRMHLPLMMGGVQESQSVSWLHSNENQHMLLSSQPSFLPQRDAECSTYPSFSNCSDYFSPRKTAIENTRPVDNTGQDSGALNELDAAACLRLQLNDQYPYQPYSSLDISEAKKLNPESEMNLQGHPLDYHVDSSVQLPRPIFDNVNHTWVPTSEPFTISTFNDNPYSQKSNFHRVILLDKVTENDRYEAHLLQVAEIRIWENEVASL
ncbi:AGAMOUS-like 65 [Actinidia rufa]|uniref:AGAMOUS-like 65 n=1 Tax=Actinidia rufa TaxID=165716 RepID=A0A7J0H3I4_9ERIC|nr:AGAMOUS-like 65 [Actinidia rufa]